ncbi:acyl-CoA synthetase [Zavarzinia sp. CC-PAN008]|uniref:acyl-CoA synthetase n=1 Tax=Zavarzinia sp. CC-PAN008 TaxID=3243332 RepID=UPI003F749923
MGTSAARPATYEEIYASQRLDVPEYYNIAADISDRHAASQPDRLAYFIEYDDRVERVTHGELNARASGLAHVLAGLGIGRGHRVAIVLPVDSAVPTTHVACWKLAAISCPMAALFGPEALAFRFANAEVSAVVTDRARLPAVLEAAAAAPSLRHILLVDGQHAGTLDYWALIAAAPRVFETVQTRAEDPAYINYTSGTTGQPKGALAAHRALLGHLPSVEFANSYGSTDDVIYSPADWAWLAGFAMLMTSLQTGRVFAARARIGFDPLDTFRFLSQHKVSSATLVPTMLRMMKAVPEEARRDYRMHLHTVVSGAEAVGAELYRWVEEVLGAKLAEAFGQTECNVCILNNSRFMAPRPGALGKAAPGYTVAIVDQDGNPVPPETEGQIAVKAGHPIMLLEYWRNPEATARKYRNGWLLTGDLGRQDEDGYFWFVARADDVITSSGYRIGPGEIEEALVKHPAVAIAAAIGIPDPIRTEVVKAFIVPVPGATPSEVLAAEIQAFVRERLARHEVPREIAFVTEMPMTTTGKIMRRVLKERDLAARAAAGS